MSTVASRAAVFLWMPICAANAVNAANVVNVAATAMKGTKISLYNRKLKRWEYACPYCGKMVWTRISRIRLWGNLSLHALRDKARHRSARSIMMGSYAS